MTTKAYAKRAKEILNEIIYATVATTSADGKPWNSPVYSAFDEDLNFYWSSDKESQHSQNIRANGNAFLVMYDSTAPEGTGEGVYIKAKVTELHDKEVIIKARRVTQSRKNRSVASDKGTRFTGDAIRRVYKAIPQRVWMNDDEKDSEGEYLRDIRVEIPLELLR